MSAFIVDKAHIDAMVQAALRSKYPSYTFSWYHDGERHQLTRANADEVGSMLLSENVRSVEYRYSPPGRKQTYGEAFSSDDDGFQMSLPGTFREEVIAEGVAPVMVPEWLTPYSYSEPRRSFSPVAILKAIECFEYQSCEHEEWPESSAFAFCRDLRSWTISKLEGYDEAEWEVSA